MKKRLLFLWILISGIWPAFGQLSEQSEWMIRTLLKDSAFEGEVLSRWRVDQNRIFWPDDIPFTHPPDPEGTDHLFKIKNKVINVISGTGRVYEFSLGPKDKVVIQRVDSSVFFGYNFGAAVFVHQDTIFSLGGYGHWVNNGHLRYFERSQKGWEIAPLNMNLPVGINVRTQFLDAGNDEFFTSQIIVRKEAIKESRPGDKTGFTELPDTMKIYRLNLKSKDWSTVGLFQNEVKHYLQRGLIISDLPFGKLVLGGPAEKFKCMLLDYRNNRVLRTDKSEIGSTLWGLNYAHHKMESIPERTFYYYTGDSLKVFSSLKQKYAFHLVESDFRPTGGQIWKVIKPAGLFSELNWNHATLFSGILFFGLGVFMLIKVKISSNIKSETINFDFNETQIIKSLLEKKEFTMRTDEIDDLLGPEGRSPDALKKRRSLIIRSINNKFTEITADPDDLISTERSEADRRMFMYILNHVNFQKLNKSLPKEKRMA